jgi:chorismate--pyruvate lyase
MASKITPRSSGEPDATRWLPAERLGQLEVEAPLRSWLIGKGLLTQRIKEACGARYGRKLVHQWPGPLDLALQSSLKVADTTGMFREVALCCSEEPWVLTQTVVPDSTLSLHPWLAELGEASLGETLNDLTGVERSAYEYARLPPEEALRTQHSLARASRAAAGSAGEPLWARRSRIRLRGAPLLVREVFLPALGRAAATSRRPDA